MSNILKNDIKADESCGLKPENCQNVKSLTEGEVKILMNGTEEEPLANPLADLTAQKLPDKKSTEPNRMRFKQKEFKVRPSLLTTLYETEARVIYNFLVALFFLLTCGVWIRDFYRTGNPLDHFWLISWNFAQLPQTMFCWTLMFASSIIFPYYGMTLWTKLPNESFTIFEKIIFGFVYIGYLFSLFYYSLKFLFYFRLSCACSMIITCENSRLAMKVHSFIRENFSRALKLKRDLAHREEKTSPTVESISNSSDWPTLQQYIYFSFCPSFLYRDDYPRAESRSWKLFTRYALQCLVTIYALDLFFVLIIYPVFNSMDYNNKVHWGDFAFSIFQSIPAGIMAMFAIFYGLLHSWLNMFAEGMRFGDRHFYSSWWKSKNMAEYYRNWNIVVHEWLYVYVYRDITTIFGSKWGPKASQLTVFFLSAAFHEYWFGVSLRQFYPVIFFMYFIAGGIFFEVSSYFRQPQVWNTLMWFNLTIGTGTFFATYATEWYARQRCPRVYESDFVDFIVPRIWSCLRA